MLPEWPRGRNGADRSWDSVVDIESEDEDDDEAEND
jgi:hypothetical protein